jgi:hypothetical protein
MTSIFCFVGRTDAVKICGKSASECMPTMPLYIRSFACGNYHAPGSLDSTADTSLGRRNKPISRESVFVIFEPLLQELLEPGAAPMSQPLLDLQKTGTKIISQHYDG